MRSWNLTNKYPIEEPCLGDSAGCRWCSITEMEFEKPTIAKPCELISSIPEIINTFDEPFADNSYIPTYLISKFALTKI